MNQQHIRHYQEKRNILEPDIRALFDAVLLEAVKTWLDMGDSGVLGIDMNKDVRTSRLTKGLQELGLYDAVLILHSPASPPATQIPTSLDSIDAIFVSQRGLSLTFR